MSEHVQPRRPELSAREMALLTGLADGALRGRRREQAELLVRELPEGERLVERQRRVARALAAGPISPDTESHAVAPRRRAQPARRLRLAVAGTMAAAVVALLIAQTGGATTVSLAAGLARLPATDPAPASKGRVLDNDVQGVAFPDWGDEFGWHETGMRHDTLNGRRTETVFYEHEGHRIAYTIISGPPLETPDGGRVIRRDGLRIAVYHESAHGGHDIAVFERDGRTCVLAGHVMKLSTLLELASWRGDGAVRAVA